MNISNLIYRCSEEEVWNIQRKAFFALLKTSTKPCYASFFTPSLFYEMGLISTHSILEERKIEEGLKMIRKLESFALSKQLPLKYLSFMVWSE